MTETVETVIARAIKQKMLSVRRRSDEVTWEEVAAEAIKALDSAGLVIAPKVPTEAMTVEGGLAFERSMFEDGDPLVFDGAAKCYRAMLATAREPSP